MSAPLPRGRLQWGISAFLFVLLVVFVTIGVLKGEPRTVDPTDEKDPWHPICASMCESHDDARRQYEEMAERQKERCSEKIAQWDKEREVLLERVEMCPCCPNGCDKELIYKDYLLQSQATYYRMILKKHCGVRRPPDPDEEELKSFAEQIEEEEDEVF